MLRVIVHKGNICKRSLRVVALTFVAVARMRDLVPNRWTPCQRWLGCSLDHDLVRRRTRHWRVAKCMPTSGQIGGITRPQWPKHYFAAAVCSLQLEYVARAGIPPMLQQHFCGAGQAIADALSHGVGVADCNQRPRSGGSVESIAGDSPRFNGKGLCQTDSCRCEYPFLVVLPTRILSPQQQGLTDMGERHAEVGTDMLSPPAAPSDFSRSRCSVLMSKKFQTWLMRHSCVT